jgi:hypothetical protein
MTVMKCLPQVGFVDEDLLARVFVICKHGCGGMSHNR